MLKIIIFYRKPQPLPSTFLKRIHSRQKAVKKNVPVTTYDRDIVCLIKQFLRKNGTIKIPRSADNLCRNGLKGKISTMTEEDIMDEIRSVFKRPFRDEEFSFDILQHGGGKFKSLVVPSLSSSFSWTANAVAGSSKSPIYILTRTNIDVSMHPWHCRCYNLIMIHEYIIISLYRYFKR